MRLSSRWCAPIAAGPGFPRRSRVACVSPQPSPAPPLRTAECVPNVASHSQMRHRATDILAVNLLSGDLRWYGEDAIAIVLQRLHDFVARSIRPVRGSYHRDGAHRLQQVPDFLVGRAWHVSLLSPAPPTPAGRSP